jgi:hypothetical protein
VSIRETASRRPRVAFIAWTPNTGRAIDIAASLGGEARGFFAFRIADRRLVPLRYLIDSVRTAAYLAWRRPRAVIVTNPPLLAVLIAYAYAHLARTPFILDSHPSSFGLSGDTVSRRLLPLHARLAPRAGATLVTDDELAAIVGGWGGRAELLHEPPPPWTLGSVDLSRERPRVLFPGTFHGDEPIREVIEAVRSLPDIDLYMTGDLRKCPAGFRASAPPNVTFLGYLAREAYRRALEEADVVVSRSTTRHSVMRTAYEAVYGHRPLVVPDRPLLRRLFPYAVAVPLTAEGIADGIREAIQRLEELVAVAADARELQEARWFDQRRTLEAIIRGEASELHPGPHEEPTVLA